MTNQEFFSKCAYWFSDLFEGVTIVTSIDAVMDEPVSMSYFGARPTINIPESYIKKSEEISNSYELDTGKLFLLLIACHELTHLLYYHHDQDVVNDNSRMAATELWADFYGAIIFFFLLYSNRDIISSILISQHNSEDKLLATYGCVVEEVLKILNSVKNSENYPSTFERIQAMIVGPLSFFGRIGRYNTVDRKIWVMQKIYGETGLLRFSINSDLNSENIELLQACRDSHLALKLNEFSLISKMKHEVKKAIWPDFL